MTKINNTTAYPKDIIITDSDYVIGSNGDTSAKTTQNYYFGNIRDYLLEGLSPEIGGTLKFTEIVNNSGAYSSPEDLINALNPTVDIAQYEVVVVTLNGNKYLFKLQNRTIGAGETAVTSSDFIILNATKSLGVGAKIHKGLNAITGEKEFRSITKVGDLIVLTENTDDVSITIDETELTSFVQTNGNIYSATNTGTGEGIYKDTTSNTFNFKRLKSTNGTLVFTSGTDDINIEVDFTNLPISVSGDFLSLTGTGTVADPFVISCDITLEDTNTIEVSGAGTVANPYIMDLKNPQKTVNTFPYTLVDADDKQTIFVENGASNVVINVPNGLVNNFTCAFIQKGTGTVTIQASGTATVSYPSTTLQNIIKGQYYWAMVEKEIATDTYYLIGSLTLV